MNKLSGLADVLANIGRFMQCGHSELINEAHRLLLELGSSVDDSESHVSDYTLFIYGIGQFDIHINHISTKRSKVVFLKGVQLKTRLYPNSKRVKSIILEKSKGLAHNIDTLKDNGYIVIKSDPNSSHRICIGRNMEYVGIETSDSDSDVIESIACFDRGVFTMNCTYLEIKSSENGYAVQAKKGI